MQETVTAERDLAEKLEGLTKPVTDLDEGLLVSATYDGDKKVAVLKFYDAKRERVWLWEDNTGHVPYCYSRLPMEKVMEAVTGRKDIVEVTEETKLDLLNDSKVTLRKIIATDPLAIGGNPGKSIRDFLECWEADIKYFENYVYDKGLKVGTYYSIAHGTLVPVDKEVGGDVKRSLDSILAKATGDASFYIRAWADLLGQPLSDFKRIACDIEVANEENRIPDPETADREVIAVSFYNDEESIVYMMDKTGQDKSLDGALTGYTYTIFPDEASLLRAAFAKMMDYPFLITFNGDDFDLRYLKHRAMRKEIGIKEEEIPIALQRQEASLKHGVHIDLYRFFNNRSIQVYVYNNRYTEHTLNGIAEAILGKEKIPFEGNIAELPLVRLADYCLNDSSLTYELTSANDSLLMKMLLVISRIAKMPMNDVARLGVSNWIRSMIFYDHRRRGALIPRSDELKLKGGASSEAIIKGKKYKGGLVIEPKPGIYFGVSVLDFASLYPSIIKVHNLSYETVNCVHDECRTNRVPDTDHWICTKRSGIESLLIGSLRDLRVGHYKALAKDKALPKESRDLYSTVSQGLKVILNASYGTFGFETFALYCLPVADATAAFGRDAITRTIEKCKQEDVSVIYSDTDSLFIENPNKEKVADVLKWADKELGVELEVDKTYRYVAFSQLKKNYFGVLQDGTADIKGLTGKKSISGDTPILARIDGDTSFTSVEEVYKRFALHQAVELLTVDDNLRTKWVTVADASQHMVDDVYILRTGKGRILKMSGDHSAYFMDDSGMLHCKETRRVAVGDVLVGARLIPPNSHRELTLDLQTYIGETIDRNGMLCSSLLHSTTGATIQRMLPMTKDVGLIFGLFIAEGSTSHTRGSRSNEISQSELINPEVCEELKEAWSRTFGWDLKGFRGPNELSYYLPILYARLFRATCGGMSQDKRVPDFIFNASLEVMASFLRGLFSGDGYSNGKKISIASESRSLIEQVCYLLSYFDIDCRIRKCYNSQFGIFYYQLSVIGTSSRRRFQEQIGFLQPRFQKIPSNGPRNKELLPISARGLIRVKGTILERMGLTRFRLIKMHDETLYNLSLLDHYNGVIDALLEHADSSESSVLASIRTMLNSQDVSYDEVVEVKRVGGSCTMYDFSVPETERFVAGNLPSLLHNSQTPEFLKNRFYETLDVLGAVYSQADFEQAKARIKKLLTEMVASLRDRKVPIEDLSFNVMMGKSISGYKTTRGPEPAKQPQMRGAQSFLHERPEEGQDLGFSAASMSGLPQHVKAAILLRSSNKEVKAGELISFVKTKGGHGVKPTVQAKSEDIDVEKYIEYASSMFDQVLSALDLSFESVVPKTSLDAFWS